MSEPARFMAEQTGQPPQVWTLTEQGRTVVLGPAAALPIRPWMLLLLIVAGPMALYIGWRNDLLLITGAIVGITLLICIVINLRFWIEQRKGDYLRYIRQGGVVELPRSNMEIDLAQVDHLQVLNGMRPMAGSKLNSNSWSEMNLVAVADGDQKRYPIIGSSHTCSVDLYAQKLSKIMAVPVKTCAASEVEAK